MTSSDRTLSFQLRARNAANAAGAGGAATAMATLEDRAAPELAGAEVLSSQMIRLLLDERPADPLPAAGAFRVRVTADSAERRPVPLLAFRTGGADGITLLLDAADAVRPDEAVAVTYMPPAENPLRDGKDKDDDNPAGLGNRTPAFTTGTDGVPEVDNRLPHTAPAAPGSLAAAPGVASGTMVLTWDTAWHNGSEIGGYQVRFVAGDTPDGEWTDIPDSRPGDETPAGANANRHTLTGLTATR